MKRVLARVLGAMVVLIVALVAVGWLLLRASLPDLQDDVVVAGIDDAVTIERDANGIPVITASTRSDLAFGTGFAHGQDRFFQMDLIRRQAAGELSELVGAPAINVDRRYRFHRFRTRAQTVYEAATEAERQLMEAYAAGVNAGLASLDARPFEYFVLGSEPRPWEPQDSLLAVYAMYMQLNDPRASKETRRGLAHSVLPPEVYAWMYPQGTSWDAPIMGEARATASIPSADVYSIRHVADTAPPANEQGRYPLRGSNNWAVSGALTSNGRALVSNDMHLGHAVPNIWYQARLRIAGPGGRDVAGVTLPGAPFVISGSNTHVAWGYTNSYGDWTDAVVLRPGEEEGTYKTPEGDREFEMIVEVINVKDADPD